MNLEKEAEYYKVKAAYLDMLIQKNAILAKIAKMDENIEIQKRKVEELELELELNK